MPRKKNRPKKITDEAKRIIIEEIKKRNVEIEEKNQKIGELKKEVETYKRRWYGLNHFVRESSDYKLAPEVKWLKEEYAMIAANNRAIGKVVESCGRCSHMLNALKIPRLEFPLE